MIRNSSIQDSNFPQRLMSSVLLEASLEKGWELIHGFDHDSPRGTIVHIVNALEDSYQIDGLENPDLTFFGGLGLRR